MPDQRRGVLWVAVPGVRRRPSKPYVSWRPVLIQVALTAALVIGLVTVAGTVEARRTAEQEAVENASQTTGLLVKAAVQPAITDDLLQPPDESAAAGARMRLDAI